MSVCLRITLTIAGLVAASAAMAQKSTALHARSYVLSAFISGAAPAIVSDEVVVAQPLRERLGLGPTADSHSIYEALFALTENKRLEVRAAAPEEMPTPVANGHKAALVTLQSNDLRLFFQYDLERDRIVFVSDGTSPVADTRAPAAPVNAQAQIIQLPDILFGFDQATLEPHRLKELEGESIAKLFSQHAARYVVRGYADHIGPARYNERLSRQRAEAVRDYLVAQGADPANIELAAFGSAMSQAHCSAELDRATLLSCLAPDRRVEVEVRGPQN